MGQYISNHSIIYYVFLNSYLWKSLIFLTCMGRYIANHSIMHYISPKLLSLEKVDVCDMHGTIHSNSTHSLHHATGETASGVIVLESAVRQYEEVLGIRHRGVVTLSKKAETLLAGLEPEKREQVSSGKALWLVRVWGFWGVVTFSRRQRHCLQIWSRRSPSRWVVARRYDWLNCYHDLTLAGIVMMLKLQGSVILDMVLLWPLTVARALSHGMVKQSAPRMCLRSKHAHFCWSARVEMPPSQVHFTYITFSVHWKHLSTRSKKLVVIIKIQLHVCDQKNRTCTQWASVFPVIALTSVC